MHFFILQIGLGAVGSCSPILNTETPFDINAVHQEQFFAPLALNTNGTATSTLLLSRKVNTTLGISVFLIATAMYWFLMRYTRTLSTEIVLPTKLLEDNIGAMLSLTWPQHANLRKRPRVRKDDDWNLTTFEKPFPKSATTPKLRLRGAKDITEDQISPKKIKNHRSLAVVKIFSPGMKSLIQTAIWNSISFWLVIVMIINTLVYNGFTTNDRGQDSIIRLMFVGIYGVANFIHQLRTATLLYRNFTYILFQTCWVCICKGFVFTDSIFKDDKKCWWTCHLELLSTTERQQIYHAVETTDAREIHVQPQNQNEPESKNIIAPLRDAEIKSFEKSADSTLEKILANTIILLGICLATALAPWTSTETHDYTSTQLGSYASLLSVSTGLVALIGSLTQLTNATESARAILLSQEKIINGHGYKQDQSENLAQDEDISFSPQTAPRISFSRGIVGQSQISALNLLHTQTFLGKIYCVLCSTSLSLIGRSYWKRERMQGDAYKFCLYFKVGEDVFNYTPVNGEAHILRFDKRK